MYTLLWSSTFNKSAEKFIKRHPELKDKFAAVLRELENNPFQPHLKYHQLGGNLKDIQAVSITYSYRITLTIILTDSEIILLDVGSHDEVYR